MTGVPIRRCVAIAATAAVAVMGVLSWGVGAQAASRSSVDPVWAGITGDSTSTDPAAGQWFPQQALQLAQPANPPER